MSVMDQLVETRIRQAESAGDFDNLPGQGKPLVPDDNALVPEEVRVGYRLLKNAGAIPPELQRRLEINALQQTIHSDQPDDLKRSAYLKICLLKSGIGQ